MNDAVDTAGHSARDRLGQLVDRLLASAEKAASRGDWDRVEELAQDVLAAAPEDRRAADMLRRARLEQSPPSGERALVTMLFSDIVRSTDMAEAAEPETMRDLFGIYRDVATSAIEGLDGSVLHFLGDGIVACFGHPTANEDDARRAVLAGLEIVKRMAAARPETRRRLGVEASVRVGIHTGMVVAGVTLGLDGRPDVVGAAPNIAARVQAVAEPDTVVVSAATRQLVERNVDLVSLGEKTLRGVAQPVEVFRVQGARTVDADLDPVRLRSAGVVGRQEVRQRLHDVWEQTHRARSSGEPPAQPVVVLRGPPGIGKTRIAADLCDQALARGGDVLRATCTQYHANAAFWPIARLIERRLGLHADQTPDERLGIVRARLAELGFEEPAVPLVASVLGLEGAGGLTMPDLNPLARRAQTLDLLERWVGLVASCNPTLLVVDDLQWADSTTLEMLGRFAGRPTAGLMVVVITRERVPASWSRVVVVELGPLTDDEAEALAAGIAGGLDAGTLRQIAERSGGIPLFVEELARSAATGQREEGLPARLQELFAARLRAPGIDLRLVQLAATLGSLFDDVLLAELAGTTVDEALFRLEAAGIVERLSEQGRRTYQFSHVLLRDAAYETQVLEVRTQTHLHIARILEAAPNRSPGDAALIAQHLDLAGEVGQAVQAYIEAAQQAQDAASYMEARELLSRALTLLATTPEGRERDFTEILIRLQRGRCVSFVAGFPSRESLEDFQAADDLCLRHRDRPEVIPAELGIWIYFFARGEPRTAEAVIQRAAASIDRPPGSRFAAEVRDALGYTAVHAGRLTEARSVLERAWTGFMERQDRAVASFWGMPIDPVSSTACALSLVAALDGRTRESDLWRRRSEERAESIGFPHGPSSMALNDLYQAWVRLIFGDPEGTYRYASRAIGIGRRYGFDYLVLIGRPYALAGEPGPPADPERLATLESELDTVGHGTFRSAYLSIVARMHARRGNPRRALESIERAFALMRQLGEWVHHPDLLRLRAALTASLGTGRMDAAVDDLRAAVQIGLEQGSLVLALRAADDLARLPADVRPPDWQRLRASVVDRLPPSFEAPAPPGTPLH